MQHGPPKVPEAPLPAGRQRLGGITPAPECRLVNPQVSGEKDVPNPQFMHQPLNPTVQQRPSASTAPTNFPVSSSLSCPSRSSPPRRGGSKIRCSSRFRHAPAASSTKRAAAPRQRRAPAQCRSERLSPSSERRSDSRRCPRRRCTPAERGGNDFDPLPSNQTFSERADCILINQRPSSVPRHAHVRTKR